MPLPTGTDVHVDAALSQVSISYKNASYIYDRMFPYVTVPKQSDKYFTFAKADLFTDDADIRAPGASAKRGGYRVSSTSFFCDDWAFSKQLPDEVRDNADAGLQIEQADTDFVTDKLMLRLERQLVSEAFVTSVWGTTITPGTVWTTYATSAPLEDIAVGVETVLKNTGFAPNKFIMGQEVWTDLKNHPDIVDRLPVTGLKDVQLAAFAQLIGVSEALVGQSVYNSAAENETASMAYNWGKNALLLYVPPSPGVRTPSAGYTFRWGNREVLKFRDSPDDRKADVIMVHEYVDFVLTGTDLGYFFLSCVS